MLQSCVAIFKHRPICKPVHVHLQGYRLSCEFLPPVKTGVYQDFLCNNCITKQQPQTWLWWCNVPCTLEIPSNPPRPVVVFKIFSSANHKCPDETDDRPFKDLGTWPLSKPKYNQISCVNQWSVIHPFRYVHQRGCGHWQSFQVNV